MEDKLYVHEIYPIEEAQDTPSESSTDSNSEEFSVPQKVASASPSVTRAMGNLGAMLSSAMKETSPASERNLRRTYSMDSKPRYSPSSLRNLPQRNPSLDRIIDYGRATLRNSATAPTGAATGSAGRVFTGREIDFSDSGSESDSELSEHSSFSTSSSSSRHSGRIIGLSVPFQEDYMTGPSPLSSKSVSRSSSRPEEIVKSVKSEPVPALSANSKNTFNHNSNNQLKNKAKMYQQQQYYPQQEEVVYEQPQQRRKFLRNPFKHQQPQQVVEESYESYPSEEEQYYEQPVYEQYEQPQQQQHFWNKHQRNVQQQQQQYYPEQGQYSTSSEEQDFGPAPMSWKKKVWNHSKPFIIKSGTTLLLSVLLPPKYVPMARNFIFKILGVPPSGVIPAQPSVRGGRFGGYEQAGAYPQQAYVGKRKVGKATFRKVLLLGGGLVATGLSALMAWRYLLKPKFGKNIYSTEPKALGKLEKDEEMDEQLAHQPSRMVESRIKKSAFGIKGSPAVLEKRSRSKKYQEPEIHHEAGAYVDDSTRPALYGQLKNEMQSRNI